MDELKSAHEVTDWLTRSEGLDWIAKSSLHLRAFYWGLYCGLGLNDTERERRESVLVHMWADTMFMRPADDPFRLTELHSHIEVLRTDLHKRIEARHRKAIGHRDNDGPDAESDAADQSAEVSFMPLLECLQKLDETWTYHRSLVLGGLEQAASAIPDEALNTLDSLERAFRILAVGDRAARRSGAPAGT